MSYVNIQDLIRSDIVTRGGRETRMSHCGDGRRMRVGGDKRNICFFFANYLLTEI